MIFFLLESVQDLGKNLSTSNQRQIPLFLYLRKKFYSRADFLKKKNFSLNSFENLTNQEKCQRGDFPSISHKSPINRVIFTHIFLFILHTHVNLLLLLYFDFADLNTFAFQYCFKNFEIQHILSQKFR